MIYTFYRIKTIPVQKCQLMASNSPFKVPQSPSTTLMPGYSESRPRKAGIIIIDPNTGNEVVLNSTQMPLVILKCKINYLIKTRLRYE